MGRNACYIPASGPLRASEKQHPAQTLHNTNSVNTKGQMKKARINHFTSHLAALQLNTWRNKHEGKPATYRLDNP